MRSHFTPEDILKAPAIEDRLYAQTWLSLDYDLLVRLRNLKVPTLVIHGDHDFVPLVEFTEFEFEEGIAVTDIDAPQLVYGLLTGVDSSTLDNAYSGKEAASSVLALKTNGAKRVAGRLRFDKTSIGGPKVDISFDATVVKEFAKAS